MALVLNGNGTITGGNLNIDSDGSASFTSLSVTAGNITQVSGGVTTFLGEDGLGGSLVGTTSNHHFRIVANNTEQMRIDTSGRVTMPYQPAWHYIGGTPLSQNAWTTIVPTGPVISNTNYNTSNGAFTAPVAGKYFFGVWGLVYPASVDILTYGVFKNGASVGHQVQRGSNSQGHVMISVGLIVNCAASDSLDFRIFTTASGITAYNTQWNQFGYLIG